MIIVLRLKDDSPLAQWIEKCRDEREPRSKVVLRKLALLHAMEELVRMNSNYRRAYAVAVRELHERAQKLVGV